MLNLRRKTAQFFRQTISYSKQSNVLNPSPPDDSKTLTTVRRTSPDAGPYYETPLDPQKAQSLTDDTRSSQMKPQTLEQPSVLPPELLLHIFRLLVEDAYHKVTMCHFPYFHPGHTYRLPKPIKPSDCLAPLLQVTRVCRAWRAVAMEVLYARPFLTSRDQILAFEKVIDIHSNRYPKFVRGLYLNNDTVQPKKRDTWRTRQARLAISSILHWCDSIQSLVINNAVITECLLVPIDEMLCSSIDRKPSIGSRLLHLTILRSLQPRASFSDPLSKTRQLRKLHLPLLETLCLRQIHFNEGDVLPHLPNLHTLRIVQCHLVRPGTETFKLDPDLVPNLRTLDLYQNGSTFPFDTVLANRLRSLHLVGDMNRFKDWEKDIGLNTPLQDVAIGSIHSLEHRDKLESLQLPYHIQTLTFFVTVPPGSPFEIAGPFESLCKAIRSNLTTLISLKKLIVVFGPEPDTVIVDEVTVLLDELRMECEKRRVSLFILTDGFAEIATRRVSPDELSY